jgi:hypothetical protein
MKRIVVILFALLPTVAPILSSADVTERPSTLADRQSVNLTIYNDGTALIHDRRRVALDAGLNRIAWRDVSANMQPESAILDSLDKEPVSVLEQNFDYDVLNQDSLLHKYVGQEVTIVHTFRSSLRPERERARILSVDNGIVLQYADRIETNLNGYIEFPSIPKNLRDQPTLILDVQSDAGGTRDLDLRYLSGGMSWSANYVGTLNADESRLNLTGLVTLSNTSGATYENARLQLVAGNVNVAQPQGAALKSIARVTSSSNAYTVNGVSQEAYFEYHLYTVNRPTTVLNNQTKQLTLLAAHGIPVRKTLELRGSDFYYYNANADLGERLRVGVFVSFENRGGELGIPLPAGIMRIYQDDSHGLSQFVGSDSIDHTPRNDTVRLHLGDSFDLVARKRQTDFHFISGCETSSSYEVTIVNGKDEPQDVLVVEPIPAEWTIPVENMTHTKSSASTATWTVHAPKDGKTTLTYTADVRWCD